MSGIGRQLRRLRDVMEKRKKPNNHQTNDRAYEDWLARHEYDPLVTDDQADAMYEYARSPQLINEGTVLELVDRFGIPLPSEVYRGEGLNFSMPRVARSDGKFVTGPASVSSSRVTAETFAERAADEIDELMGSGTFDDLDQDRYHSVLASLRPRRGANVRALPLPMSTESEFVLPSDVRSRRIDTREVEMPDDDRITQRLYELFKKRGGRVSANY